jgi:hypothetical protein
MPRPPAMEPAMPRPAAVLRGLGVLAAATPALLATVGPRSYGWFAYTPTPMPWEGPLLWVDPLLPFALALLALWAPRLMRPVGIVLALVAAATGLFVPGPYFLNAVPHWASIAAPVVAAALLLAARGAAGRSQALVPTIAWTFVLLVVLMPLLAGTHPVPPGMEATSLALVCCAAAVAAQFGRTAS